MGTRQITQTCTTEFSLGMLLWQTLRYVVITDGQKWCAKVLKRPENHESPPENLHEYILKQRDLGKLRRAPVRAPL